MCSFIIYFLWAERCKMNFDDTYSSSKIVRQALVSTIEAGMVAWKALFNTRTHETLEAKANLALIRVDFIFTWCFLNLFIHLDKTMKWSFLPLLSYLDYDFMM